jgi:hypothetical protein
MSQGKGRNFWRDLYPLSETRRRFSRSSYLWIYLPIAASALVAVGAAIALLGFVPGNGFELGGQLAAIILAAVLLAAGFLSWLVILAFLWGLNDLLEILPALTSRMRLRFVIGARSWKRGFTTVKRTSAAISRFFSPKESDGKSLWKIPMQRSRRRGEKDE